MTTRSILVKARRFVASGWCQHDSAIDSNGRAVQASFLPAVAWCPLGAIAQAEAGLRARGAAEQRLFAALRRLHPGELSIQEFNDRRGRTQAQVLAVFDEALKARNTRRMLRAAAGGRGR